MAKLGFNYESANKLGTDIKTEADSFNTLLKNISTVTTNVENSWKGTDAAAYTSKVKDQMTEMNNLHKTIEDIGQYLLDAASAYKNTIESHTLK